MPNHGRFAREGEGSNRGGKKVAPEPPRQQQKGRGQSPLRHRRRSSNQGSSASSSTTAKTTAGSGSGSDPGFRSHPPEEGSVRVVVRVRPLSSEEEVTGSDRIMKCCSPKLLEFTAGFPIAAASSTGGGGINGDSGVGMGITSKRAYSLKFDLCAHEGFSQKEMFQSCGLMPLLSAAVDGYAGTVFAYGATGSGKTYTMSGRGQELRRTVGNNNRFLGGYRETFRDGGGDISSTEGLITRSMRYVFQRIASLDSSVTMRVRASFYEIYNEFVYDLLAQDDRRPLQVRYDVKRGFFVQGLLEVEIRSLGDILTVVNEGNGNRRVSSHLINKYSSRSHSLLSVGLQRELKDPEDGHLIRTFGKVTFVDLAGSERLKNSRAPNEKETASINKSLMTLGKVISALSRKNATAAASAKSSTSAKASAMATAEPLSSPQVGNNENNTTGVGVVDPPPDVWVPYRDSTLTKLLMDSLGGNGLTLMLACVSPSLRHAEESVSTLNYAARARNIKNRPLVRVDARERLLNALRREVNLLREENELLRRKKLAPSGYHTASVDTADVNIPGSGTGIDEPVPFAPQSVVQPRGEGKFGDKSVILAHQQQEELNALEIGQASRDVAALLRKYEEECHRLRREAALAQYKTLEISKQTRQALVENEALSRTVERLQKTFGAEQSPRPSIMGTLPLGQQHQENGNDFPQNLETEKNGGASNQPQSSAADAATLAGANEENKNHASADVMHLRRVNEALVERLEAVERSHSKIAAVKTREKAGGKKRPNAEPRGQRIADRIVARSAADSFGKMTPPVKLNSATAPWLMPTDGDESGSFGTRAARRVRQLEQRDPRGRLIPRGLKVKYYEPLACGEISSPTAVQSPQVRLVGGPGRGIDRRGRLERGRDVGRPRRLGAQESGKGANGQSLDADVTWGPGASNFDPPPAANTVDPAVEEDGYQPEAQTTTLSLASAEGNVENKRKEATLVAECASGMTAREHDSGKAARDREDPKSTTKTSTREGGEGKQKQVVETEDQPRLPAKQARERRSGEEEGKVKNTAMSVSKKTSSVVNTWYNVVDGGGSESEDRRRPEGPMQDNTHENQEGQKHAFLVSSGGATPMKRGEGMDESARSFPLIEANRSATPTNLREENSRRKAAATEALAKENISREREGGDETGLIRKGPAAKVGLKEHPSSDVAGRKRLDDSAATSQQKSAACNIGEDSPAPDAVGNDKSVDRREKGKAEKEQRPASVHGERARRGMGFFTNKLRK